MESYDVIIIGAGPAGLSCAAELGNSNLKVALIDKNSTNFNNKFDAKGTSWEVIKELNLEKSILSKQKTFGMYSSKEKKIFTYPDYKVCVVDYFKLLSILKKRSNCKFINAEIQKVNKNKKGVKLADINYKNYFSKLLIDCSGNCFVTANSLNLKKPKIFYHCISMILTNCNNIENEMSLYMDTNLCNSSAWFYPIDSKRCQIGVGEMAPYKIVSRNQLRETLLKVRELYPYKNMLKNSKILESSVVYGHNPVIQPLEEMQQDNIIFAGDSAGMATPLVGDGLRPSLIGGKNAGIITKKAFKLNKFSKEILQEHEKIWWLRFGRHYIWMMLLRHLICLHFNSDDWDEIIKKLKKIDKNEFWEIITSRLTFARFNDLIDFKIVKDVFIDELKTYLPHLDIFNERHNTSNFI